MKIKVHQTITDKNNIKPSSHQQPYVCGKYNDMSFLFINIQYIYTEMKKNIHLNKVAKNFNQGKYFKPTNLSYNQTDSKTQTSIVQHQKLHQRFILKSIKLQSNMN